MVSNNVIIIMGVSGCGKSTIGSKLAEILNIPFFDADDFHPQVNRDKMASGKPLNDSDRQSWLDHLAIKIKDWNASNNSVLACSALKESYRKCLASQSKNIRWVFLEGSFKTIKERMKTRKDHFFKPDLLSSQFEILEAPNQAIKVSIENSPEEIIKSILKGLKEYE